jgi:hypothetical protein
MAGTTDFRDAGGVASGPSDLPAPSEEDGARSSTRLARLTWGFVALGLIVRAFRYAMDFPLWGDEAALAANFLSRGYRGLLAPLEFYQVAPPLFLWVELTVVKAFGFSEYSLRLFPFACGLASMVLFRHVARRLLGGLPMLLAVGVFAVAPHPIRHCADVKPYATDLLVALGLLALAVDWLREPGHSRRLWWLAIASPLAMGLSHPAAFVAMGIGLALAIPAWRTGRWSIRLGAAAALVAPVASFLALFVLVTGSQCDGSGLQGMRGYWGDSFPPLGEPLRLVRWLILTHTGSMFAYPDGGQRGESTATAILCIVAIVTLWRRGCRPPLTLLLAPFGLTLVAASLRRYPYGGEARIAQHLAPMICLLTGLGASVVVLTLPRPRDRSRGLALALIGLGLLGMGSVARDFATPYRSDFELHAREFARWFWIEKGRDSELACARADYGVIEPRSLHFATALYVCYREICRPRLHEGGPRLGAVTGDHPLRCAVLDEFPMTNPSFVAFKDVISARLPLRAIDRFVIESRSGPRRQVVTVFEFAPSGTHPGPIEVRETRWPPAGFQVASRASRPD